MTQEPVGLDGLTDRQRKVKWEGDKYDSPSGVTLEWLQEESYKIAKEHGWWDEERNFGELLMLCVTELSEAMEEWRHGHTPSESYVTGESHVVTGFEKPEGVPSELADVLIRIADMAQHYGISLTDAVLRKMEYNKTREYRHGGKRA